MISISFVIPGEPMPKERHRQGKAWGSNKKVWYTPERTKAYEAEVALRAKAARPSRWDPKGMFRVAIEVRCDAPKSNDLDNIMKSIIDGCNKVLWLTDSRAHICKKSIEEVQDGEPRAVVLVEPVELGA